MNTIVSKYPIKIGKIEVHYTYVHNALGKTALPGLDYSLNPYIGCSHGCTYCYARLYTRVRSVSSNWGNLVYVKLNLPKILEKEVHRVRKGLVGVGTVTDPYQPLEAVYGVTRKSLSILLENGFKISVQTKNPLILRDIDILRKYRGNVDVGFTITTTNYAKSLIIEPNAPPPLARINAIRAISSRGLKTWVFYGPVIPFFNDDESTINSIMELCLETNSRLYVDPLRVKSFMLGSSHPLFRYLSFLSERWVSDFKIKISAKCLEFGLECLEGFEESLLT